MKIDGQNNQPKDLVESILDITKSWGKETIPKLEELPKMTYDYFDDFAIEYLTPQNIIKRMNQCQLDLEGTMHYLADKLGFNHNDPDLYNIGLQTAASWSLLSNKHKHIENFVCQNTRGRTKDKLEECEKDLSKYYIY